MILEKRSHHKPILKINSIKVETRDNVLLLGMTTEKKLTFKQHIKNLCGKVQCKPASCIEMYKSISYYRKSKVFGNESKDSQFNYVQLS